jgi:peptide/nickel transport system ATP-binding protein
MSDNILSIQNLETDYSLGSGGYVKAIRSLNLDVRRGESIALVGESGSGKSTLALSIMRLIEKPNKIASGEIIFHDKDKDISVLKLGENGLRVFRWKGCDDIPVGYEYTESGHEGGEPVYRYF